MWLSWFIVPWYFITNLSTSEWIFVGKSDKRPVRAYHAFDHPCFKICRDGKPVNEKNWAMEAENSNRLFILLAAVL